MDGKEGLLVAKEEEIIYLIIGKKILIIYFWKFYSNWMKSLFIILPQLFATLLQYYLLNNIFAQIWQLRGNYVPAIDE